MPGYANLLTTMAKRPPDNDKNKYRAYTAATQFFCSVTGNQCFEKIVHVDIVSEC
jgi:hypothetical protein